MKEQEIIEWIETLSKRVDVISKRVDAISDSLTITDVNISKLMEWMNK